MSSIAVPRVFAPISAATALGVLTVSATDAAAIYPGAKAWIQKDDGSVPSARVLIVSVVGTAVKCRRFKNDNETAPGINYGVSDLSAFNTGSHLNQEVQVAPIDPSNAKRNFA